MSSYLPHNKFGLNVILPSTKCIQCQTVSRLAFKSSINENIRELWSITSTNKNIQYDIYSNTKDVLKAFRQKNEQRLQNNLISQGSFFSNIVKNSTLAFNSYGHRFILNFLRTYLTSVYVTSTILCQY